MKWKIKNGMVRPDEAVDLLTRFVAWCAVHEGHGPIKVLTVDDLGQPDQAGAIACVPCEAVFILALPHEEKS